MNKLKINIDVIGEAGSGKSSIATIILETLKSQGFDAELDFTKIVGVPIFFTIFVVYINNNLKQKL